VTSALVIMPHPDDADFGAGGTVARWVAEGDVVHYLIVTEGDAGIAQSNNSAGTKAEAATLGSDTLPVRRAEQARAAEGLGVRSVVFLEHPDGRVVPTEDLRRQLADAIRRTRPTRVLAPTPVWNLEVPSACHPDHLAVGAAACAAVFLDSRNRNAPSELADHDLEPHEVSELWLMSDASPNHAVDITDHLHAKRKAVSAHLSQLTDLDTWWTNMQRWATECAQRWGMEDGKFAEEFRIIRID
jgi:LmbE family N-acetylglucosaminyl deacetylase